MLLPILKKCMSKDYVSSNVLFLVLHDTGVPNDDVLFKKPYQIEHSNTRFQKDPFKDALDRTKLVEAASENAKFHVGERVGHDGKAILPEASPSVNGFGFVGTPSPAPGLSIFCLFYMFVGQYIKNVQ